MSQLLSLRVQGEKPLVVNRTSGALLVSLEEKIRSFVQDGVCDDPKIKTIDFNGIVMIEISGIYRRISRNGAQMLLAQWDDLLSYVSGDDTGSAVPEKQENRVFQNLVISLTPTDIGRLYLRWMRDGWTLYTLTRFMESHPEIPVFGISDAEMRREYNAADGGREVPESITVASLFCFLLHYVSLGHQETARGEFYGGHWQEDLKKNFTKALDHIISDMWIALEAFEDFEDGQLPEDRMEVMRQLLQDKNVSTSVIIKHTGDHLAYFEIMRELHDAALGDGGLWLAEAVRSEARSSSTYVENYLSSGNWKMTRLAALIRSDFQCSVCKSCDGLEVHHNTYERLGEELETDLVVLCHNDHALYHQNGRLAQLSLKNPLVQGEAHRG